MAKIPSSSNDFTPSWLNFEDNSYSKVKPNQNSSNKTSISSFKGRLSNGSASGGQTSTVSRNVTAISSRQNFKNLDSEFPSLVDKSKNNQIQSTITLTSNSSSSATVWSKPPSLKSVDATKDDTAQEEVKAPSAIYKALVPKTMSCSIKSYKRTLSSTSPSWSPTSKAGNTLHKMTPPKPNNGSPDYISNIQVLKKSKFRQRKAKTDFIIENEFQDGGYSDTNNKDSETSTNSSLINKPIAVQKSLEDDMQANLSSSLEAEHRLLKEMGWSSGDEQPLTEEEIKEYFLQHQINWNSSYANRSNERKQELTNILTGWQFANFKNCANINDSNSNVIKSNDIDETDSDLSSSSEND